MKKRFVLIVLAVIGLGINAHSAKSAPKTNLGSVEQFKAAFQNERGKVRLVALVSPT